MLVYGEGAWVNVCMLVCAYACVVIVDGCNFFMTDFPEQLFSVDADNTTLLQCSTSELKSRWSAPTANSVWTHLNIAGPRIT